LLQKIFEKFKKDEHGHGIYFPEIYWFKGVNYLFGAGGGLKVKNEFQKHAFLLHKIDQNLRILLFVGEILLHI